MYKRQGLYTNLRPVQIFNALADASTLRPEIVDGVDMMIVRELTGGLYFGRRERFYDEPAAGVNGAPGQRAYDTLEYSEYEIERIARQAFEIARKRRGKVTSVDTVSYTHLDVYKRQHRDFVAVWGGARPRLPRVAVAVRFC